MRCAPTSVRSARIVAKCAEDVRDARPTAADRAAAKPAAMDAAEDQRDLRGDRRDLRQDRRDGRVTLAARRSEAAKTRPPPPPVYRPLCLIIRGMLRTIRRPSRRSPPTVDADICVVGAGMSGVSAALEAARLGRRVVIVDAAPALGGQAVGSIIGTIIGLYTHGERPYQITHGIADAMIADLTAEGSMYRRQSATGTVTFLYDEVRLGRWVERKCRRPACAQSSAPC